MNRRTLLKRIGAVGAATLIAGTASANSGRDEVTVKFSDDREDMVITGDCICDVPCHQCICPPECGSCAC